MRARTRRHADRIAHAAHAVDPAGELPGPVDLRHRVDETAEAHHAVLRLHVDLHGAQLRIVVERARHELGNDRVAEVRALFLKLVLRGCVGEGAEPGKQRLRSRRSSRPFCAPQSGGGGVLSSGRSAENRRERRWTTGYFRNTQFTIRAAFMAVKEYRI